MQPKLEFSKTHIIITSFALLIIFASPAVLASMQTTLLQSEPLTSLEPTQKGEEGNMIMLRLRWTNFGKIALPTSFVILIFRLYKLSRSCRPCKNTETNCTASVTPEGGHDHTQMTSVEMNSESDVMSSAEIKTESDVISSVEFNTESDVFSSVGTRTELDVTCCVEIKTESDVICSVDINSESDVLSSVDSIEL